MRTPYYERLGRWRSGEEFLWFVPGWAPGNGDKRGHGCYEVRTSGTDTLPIKIRS